MAAEPDNEQREYELMLAIFSVSAGLIGVCLTGIGLLRVVHSFNRVKSAGDGLLALDAIFFLITCVLAFISFRAAGVVQRRRLRKAADLTFLLGLGLMAAVCSVLALAVLT